MKVLLFIILFICVYLLLSCIRNYERNNKRQFIKQSLLFIVALFILILLRCIY